MKLTARLQRILEEQNLTVYGAAQILGAETDEPLKTIHARISRYLKKTPKSWTEIEAIANALGYEITIAKR